MAPVPGPAPSELGIDWLLARPPSQRRFVSGQSCFGCLEWRLWEPSLSSVYFWWSTSWCCRASRGSRASPERPGPLPRRGTRRAPKRTPRSKSGPRCPSLSMPAENAGRFLRSWLWDRDPIPALCPQCGSKRVEQIFSTFATVRSGAKSPASACGPSGGG